MTGPDDLQLRLWRRALLLTGQRAGAERVLARVLGAQENPRKLSAHRRERLLLQAAREWGKRSVSAAPAPLDERDPLEVEGAARQLWRTIHSLPRQPAEAWMLLDIEGLSEIDAARAMDCSRTAMQRHREAAAGAIAPLLGAELPRAIDDLRAALAAADPGDSFDVVARLCAAARRRRRLISLGQVLLLAACMGVLLWVAADLFEANNRERERRDMGDQYSLPIGAEAPAPAAAPTKDPSK